MYGNFFGVAYLRDEFDGWNNNETQHKTRIMTNSTSHQEANWLTEKYDSI